MIKTLIVENEKPNIDYLTGIISQHFPDVQVVAICSTVLEATEKINLLKPELVFLDIGLDIEDGGIRVLQHTRSVNYEVIFTTSHANYAADAFKFCALHYLLRPFGVEDVEEALQRFKQKNNKGSKKNIDALLHNMHQHDASSLIVGIPTLEGYVFITLSDIIFCKAENTYTDFFLVNKQRLLATKTLKWVDELLREHNFFRIHESYLINLNHIKKYIKGGEGGMVELTDRYEADISRRRKDDFLKTLTNLKMLHSK